MSKNSNIVEVKTTNIQTFVKIFELLESISSDYINICFTKKNKELIIKALGCNQTSFCRVKLNNELFSSFNMKNDTYIRCLEIKELNKFLKCIDTYEDHELIICIEKDDSDFRIQIQNLEKEHVYKVYEQPFIESDELCAKDIPEEEHEYVILMGSQMFKKICKNMNEFSDYMEIVSLKDSIKFRCINKYKRLFVESFENGIDDIKIIQKNKEVKCAISSYYIETILKMKIPTQICPCILIHLKNKAPLFISGNINNNGNKCGVLVAYFSPQFSEEMSNEEYYNITKDAYVDVKASIKK